MTSATNTFTISRQTSISRFIAEYGLLVMLIVLMVIFAALNPKFLTLANLTTLLDQNSALLVISVGMTFAIISRNIDLSPASLIALSGTALGLLYVGTGSIWVGIIAAFVVAILAHLINSLLITLGDMNPLIVTLACWIWARGLAVSLTGANSIAIQDPFIDFMNRALFLSITPSIVLSIFAFIVGWVILHRTRLGRYTYAMGSDERATIQAGVPTKKYKRLMFVMFGFFAGIGAVITVSRLGAAAPDAAYGLELDAIVAVIIGGNPFQGGEGNLRRTLIGALFIAVLNNGLSNLGMLDSQIAVYKGAAIIVALLFGVVGVRLLRRNNVGGR
jgi:ribose/xylose/arabinose/galactoside ABC-type transport system permease subunit